ncbi:type I pantothenate kinase [Aeromicrobium duanguangcaii]|uniref:Pantothenate kinase n=1 Tax=Aeromicrobium duanguangcaii TaxID=2968086 RepID=A0ABY5KHR8_9ACTN|nr:type I pantothenate kinase [Aeromicrobium duanguangcaii]MCD9153853.1 type I pantothenate kinase [Aeromicrobium duanguangcaii]MCL3837578.1 type I pantothenate kinase [Aeromicrobium duanguangcaii]UUI70009.1 type I pantothenate kinase [Aeromicrobium duanguangcaii]
MGGMSRDPSPYVELERSAWAKLAHDAVQPMSPEEVERVRGLGEELDLDEVQQVYVPLTQLISLRVRLAEALYRATERFLGDPQPDRVPFIIGLAGSVAVGKSTTARLLRDLLAQHDDHPNVALITTDGFLLPNAELERRGIMHRKGFPESYDRKALLRFVMQAKSGAEVIEAPVYDHLTYDRTDETISMKRPDILIVEGLNVLAPPRSRGDGSPGLAISDFFDFSIYVDANSRDIRRWYISRFLRLRETAFADPASYFHRYSTFTDAEAQSRAEELWDTINWPNLRENVATTRGRADLVLRKSSDHSVQWVRLRKL